MKLWPWYKDRGPIFVSRRATLLFNRYNLTPTKTQSQINACLTSIIKAGCAPTFPIPGILAERYPEFVRQLQDKGAEIAVHGYQHINLNDLPVGEARRQLERAFRSFERLGIQVHGFRGPYIGCCDELIDSLPPGLFSYSSNKAIRWHFPISMDNQESGFYNTLEKFYHAKDSAQMVCIPWNRSNSVEIPVCIPDDLQILDGLRLGNDGLALAWQRILQQTYRRGELFTLLFHTELAVQCEQPLVDLLYTASVYRPRIWFAKLVEISDWWKEKTSFKIEVIPNPDGLTIKFFCTPRATILIRGLGSFGSERVWDGAYYRLPVNTLTLPAGMRPFIGLDKSAPQHVVSFLQEQGYIVETGEMAYSCGTYIDTATLTKLSSQVLLIEFIENQNSPLVRFGRWPDGAKSALCVTGDLDALTLFDYASRFIAR